MLSPRQVAAYWYRACDATTPVAQGDQFWDVEIFDAYVDDAGTVCADRLRASFVVLTQSCDLEHEKVTTVLTAPVYLLDDWLRVNPADLTRLEDIRRGYDPSLYLLPAWPDAPVVPARHDRVVHLGELRVVPFALLRAALNAGTDRAALSSPAREHFSQAVARTFMRVGLPADIPSFELKRVEENERLLTDLLFENGLRRLLQPLRVSCKRYRRGRTDDSYWMVTTKGHSPSLIGAGSGEAQAIASLGSQVMHALDQLRGGDTTWSWLEEHLGR